MVTLSAVPVQASCIDKFLNFFFRNDIVPFTCWSVDVVLSFILSFQGRLFLSFGSLLLSYGPHWGHIFVLLSIDFQFFDGRWGSTWSLKVCRILSGWPLIKVYERCLSTTQDWRQVNHNSWFWWLGWFRVSKFDRLLSWLAHWWLLSDKSRFQILFFFL